MKNFMKHIGFLVVAMVAYTGAAYAQFDDVYFDPSKDVYAASTNSMAPTTSQRSNSNIGSSSDQSYNYTRNNDRARMDDGQYAYDDDEYDYYNDDYSEGNYYFDDYAYTRRINRFHRNRFFYDPFMYDDFFMMGSMYHPHRFYNPYRFSGFGSPFYRPGLSFSLGFGMGYGLGSHFGMGYPMHYGNMYGRFYNPYRYGFYDPILAYNSYGYGYGYDGGIYGSRYPYVYRNNVNHGERPVYYNNGARTSGAGLVPTARDGRIQVRSSGSNSSDGYVQPTTRTSPRSSDRSNKTTGSVRSSGDQKLSPRTSGRTNTNASPRSNTYTPDRKGTTNRVYRTPSRVEQKSSGDRSTYTPRSSSRRNSYTPSKESPRRSYTPSSGSSRRTYTPSSRSSGRDYTPSSRNSGSTINRSAPSRRSYTPSSSSGSSSSRSSGSSSSSSRRSSPR
ncbi:hypothetical protein KUV50_08855 [Membranicola marinus]|uniref:Uncharacterized protein n=1 Tax=Membranihabitans marinus TaxID=1227546 RepID=A0A953HM93_9BACT|nr:hypothetical protein [Membranihabitans marinus]MBY5958237.1 hypothetical protein [Membranihabitans marinus]